MKQKQYKYTLYFVVNTAMACIKSDFSYIEKLFFL